jgi:hypothetical protein
MQMHVPEVGRIDHRILSRHMCYQYVRMVYNI